MATADSNKDEPTKRPDKKMVIIAAVLVTVMLVVMGVLVVVLLKLSNAPMRQVTTIVDPNGGETVISDDHGEEAAKEGKRQETTLVKADAEKVKEAQEQSKAAHEESKAKHGEKKAKDDRPSFYKFSPPFIVNIPSNGRLRFLQVEVQLMAKSEEDVKNIESYAPVIRNDLITLFSSQNYDDLLTPDGKENLRKSALTVSRKILKDNTGSPCVEQVLFTNFVTQ